jgi:hypothetical protein
LHHSSQRPATLHQLFVQACVSEEQLVMAQGGHDESASSAVIWLRKLAHSVVQLVARHAARVA